MALRAGVQEQALADLPGAGIRGDLRDDFGGGSWTDYSVVWTSGQLDIESAAERAIDAVTAGRLS